MKIPQRQPNGANIDFLGLFGGALEEFFSASNVVGDILGFIGRNNDDIADLQDKTQNLGGVIGYGCATSAGTSGQAGGGKFVAPFTTQIGPLVGVIKTGNSFILQSKGLWRVDAMQFFDFYTLGANQVDMDIRVYDPAGALFVQRFNHNENAGSNTLSSILSFVAPAAGYKVEVWVQAAAGRGIFGGNSYSSLNVTKISNETS